MVFSKTLPNVLVNSLIPDQGVNVLALFWERCHSGDLSRKCLTGLGERLLSLGFVWPI